MTTCCSAGENEENVMSLKKTQSSVIMRIKGFSLNKFVLLDLPVFLCLSDPDFQKTRRKGEGCTR